MLRLICGHAPQSGIHFFKKSFYDKMKGEWDTHSAGDLVMYLGVFNGHVGRNIGEYDGVHGGYGAGQRNLEECY